MPEAAVAPQAELPLAPPVAPAAAPKAPGSRRFELPPEPATPLAPAEGASPAAQNIGDQATPPAPEEKPETPEQAAKREGRRFGRKLDKAYKERAEAQAERDFLKAQIAELQKPQAPVGEPRLEQFDYDPEKYAKAKADYAKSQVEKELYARQSQESAKQFQARLQTGWEDKVDKAQGKYDDFQEVVGELEPNSPFVIALMEADNGEDIAYHLGKNPKEAERIASLHPTAQIREIGKLEAKLMLEPKKPIQPSKAPAPITPVTGAAPATTTGPSENDSTAEWIRKRNKQVAVKRR